MKKRIRKTGDIVDVISYNNLLGADRSSLDSVSYIDSKGNECVKVKMRRNMIINVLSILRNYLKKNSYD